MTYFRIVALAGFCLANPLLYKSLHASEETAANTEETIKTSEQITVTGYQYSYNSPNVKGLKTNIPLINTPASVSIVTRQQIEDQAHQDIGDILRYTPGVSIGQGEGHRDQITLRGQNTTADFFVDGIRDDVQYFRPLYNIENVEVLKGSNAMIFGRGGGGGVINRVTKLAVTNSDFVNFNTGIDTFGAYQVTVDGNKGLNEDMAFRLNALAETFENHRDVFEGERYAINPTMTADLNRNTRLYLSYEYNDDDRVVDRGVPARTGGTLRNPVNPVSGFEDTFFGSPSANTTTLQKHAITGRLLHTFSNRLQFSGTVFYANFDKLYQNLFPVASDLANDSVTLDGYRDTTQRENLIGQAHFLADVTTGTIRHEVLWGAELGNQDTTNARHDVLFTASADDQITFAFTDPLNIPEFSFPVTTRDRDSDVQYYSLFVRNQITLSQHFQLVAGLRLDRFEMEVTDRANNTLVSRTDTEFSPRAGFIYKPQNNLSFYISYSQSFLPRGGDQFLTLTTQDLQQGSASLAPEEFENLEFGTKWDLMDRLSFSAALFRLNRDNGTTVDPNNPADTILISSITEGLELQLIGEPISNWRMTAGYSYLDAKEDGRIVGGIEQNRKLSQVPTHMFSIWNRYQFTSKLAMGLGLTHQGNQFASISNTVELPDFTRVDAAAYYAITDKVRVQLNVENLLDENYYPAAHNDNNISTGEPINARLSLNIRL